MAKPKSTSSALLLELLVPIASCGAVLSLLVHLYAILDREQPFGRFTTILHIGAALAAVTAVCLGKPCLDRIAKHNPASLKQLLSYAPGWLKWLCALLFVYAGAHGYGPLLRRDVFMPRTSADYQILSSHWIFFYCTALLVAYSLIGESKQQSLECSSHYNCS